MAQLTDLSFEGDRIYFSWKPDDEDCFQEELDMIKDELAACRRKWSPERKQWVVNNDEETLKTLAFVFPNGASMVRNVLNQMDLFTRG